MLDQAILDQPEYKANIDNSLVAVFNNNIVNSLNNTIEGLVERQIEDYEEDNIEGACSHIDVIKKHVYKVMLYELQSKLNN